MTRGEWAIVTNTRALGGWIPGGTLLHATRVLPRRTGVKRKQPLVVMGGRRLYNFSLNTKKASRQNSRILEEKKADTNHHSQEHKQSTEKVIWKGQ